MKTNYQFPGKKPEGFITMNQKRQQFSKSNQIHLSDNSEFEIEIYNPTQNKIGVQFEINGNIISLYHLIIKPGERFFLDRFIDSNDKFMFSTYDIDNIENLEEVKQAIANNGNIKISFYKENTINYFNRINSIQTPSSFPPLNNFYYYSSPNDPYNTTNCIRNFSSEYSTFTETSKPILETGTIEKGNKSNQQFDSINIDLEYLPFHTIEYKIVPIKKKVSVNISSNKNRLKTYDNDIVFLNDGENYEIEINNPFDFNIAILYSINDTVSSKQIIIDKLTHSYISEHTETKESFYMDVLNNQAHKTIYNFESFKKETLRNNNIKVYIYKESDIFKRLTNSEESIILDEFSFVLVSKDLKPIEAKDLIRYCTNCGTKSKKDHKFCSNCGTKL